MAASLPATIPATESTRVTASEADQPLVSVIVPAFNAAQTLEETLQSVAQQTYRPIELLVVDDGSSDDTRVMAEAFCERHGFARLFVKPNGGVASARNHAITEARGRYIAPLDADDIWHPTYLAKMVARACAAPAPPTFIYAHTRAIDAQSRIVSSVGPFLIEGPAVYALLYCNLVGNGSGMVMDAAACRAVGGYHEGLYAEGLEGCEDFLLQLKLAAYGPIAAVPEYLIGYRVTTNLMSSNFDRMLASDRRAREIFANECAFAPPPDWLRRWIEARRILRRADAARALGRPAMALRALGRAALLDPVTVVHACYSRLRTFLGRQVPSNRVNFYDADPQMTDDPAIPRRHFSRHQATRLDRIIEFEHGV